MKKIKDIQPEISIGLVGHVDHGKTSLLEQLSGQWTDTHSEELKRGITIRLGYANASIYHCKKCKQYTTKEKCEKCGTKPEFQRMVSFVDAPGHETLMATMLSGAAIMDAAILLVAANEVCPQPQTKEHLMALEIINVKNIIIVQNKIDLVTKEQALKNYNEIQKFIKGTFAEKALIIPISAQRGINIDLLIEAIQEEFKTPERDSKKDSLFFVARSFDVNKPGSKITDLKGGVLGGSLKQGILKVGDKIEIKPGLKIEDSKKTKWKPIATEVIGLMSGSINLEQANPGGSTAILTNLDPSIVKSDNLTGNVVGLVGKTPEVYYELKLKPNLLKRVVGSKSELEVDPIKRSESLMLNVNSSVTVGVVNELSKNIITAALKIPVCANKEDRVTISRFIGSRWRLIGYANIEG